MYSLDAARLSSASAVSTTGRNADDRKLRQVSEMFVGFFMGQMFKTMRSTIQTGDLGHGGSGEKMFQELADEEIAMEAAKGGGYGLADLIYQSMNRRQTMGIERLSETTEGQSNG